MADVWKAPSGEPKNLKVITFATEAFQIATDSIQRSKRARIAKWVIAAATILGAGIVQDGDASTAVIWVGIVAFVVTRWFQSHQMRRGAEFFNGAKGVVLSDEYRDAARYVQRKFGDDGPMELHLMIAAAGDDQ